MTSITVADFAKKTGKPITTLRKYIDEYNVAPVSKKQVIVKKFCFLYDEKTLHELTKKFRNKRGRPAKT